MPNNIQAGPSPNSGINQFTAKQGQWTAAANANANKTNTFFQWPPPEWDAQKQNEEPRMMDKIIRLYTAYMAMDVRSPTPHLAGPPGVGKSSMIAELAEMLGVTLHVVNVSRISPLELEGVQMPVAVSDSDPSLKLKLLHNTLWMNLKEGDIVLFDEFMRGFPEVYNGLLDIFTSREVAGYKLPKVFFIAASNSVAAYDEALRDRLLHIYVPDIRRSKVAQENTARILVEAIGLNPNVTTSSEMNLLIESEIKPMYDVLDAFKGGASNINKGRLGTGHSVRNLIGQAQLREVQSNPLKELIDYNNKLSMSSGKAQFVVLLSGRNVDPRYIAAGDKLKGNDKLTEVQVRNLELNFQLIEMEDAMKDNAPNGAEQEELDDDELF